MNNAYSTIRNTAILLILCGFSSFSLAKKPIQSIESIRDAARQFIVAETSDSGGETKISVGRLDPRLRLQQCGSPLEVYLSPGSRLIGHTTVGVRCTSMSNPWALFVPVQIEQFVPLVVASAHIHQGQMITPQMLTIEKRSTARIRNGHFRLQSDVAGKIAAREITRGSAFSRNMVKMQRLVKRGDRVVLSMQTGTVAVRMAGIALSDGARGERVRVKNLSSKRVLDGIVSSENTVLVGAGARDSARHNRL